MAQVSEIEVLGMLEARKRAGIGIERCSRISGVDIRSLIRYERGRARVGIKNAARIARVLGVRVDQVEEFLPAVREVQEAGFALVGAYGGDAQEDNQEQDEHREGPSL